MKMMPNAITFCHGLMRRVRRKKKKQEVDGDINDMLRQSRDQMTSQHAVMLERVDKVVCNILR